MDDEERSLPTKEQKNSILGEREVSNTLFANHVVENRDESTCVRKADDDSGF